MQRQIICVDMDAFFASVEQQSNPRLRGKPIAVIGSGGRTVVTTRSYEARRYGVKTGMNVYEAKRLCPEIIFVIGNNEKYTYTCSRLKEIYGRYSPEVEVYSIDEAFIDVTTTSHLFRGPLEIGKGIKQEVKEAFGITCTVGIGPNILIAKLVSDISKPDGLRWVKEEEVTELLEDLPVEELWGIGRHISERLALLGIKTCGQLARASAGLLRSKFGIIGERLKEMGMGICNRPVKVVEDEPKSIGHSMTLPKDIQDRAEIKGYLLQLCEMVCRRARAYGYNGRRVSLTIRLSDFRTFTHQRVMPYYTNHTHRVYNYVVGLLEASGLNAAVRLLGVSLSGLIKEEKTVPSLFEEFHREGLLYRAVDMINNKYGEFNTVWGPYLRSIRGSQVISPAWRPSGIRHVKVR